MKEYNPHEIEPRWQKVWAETGAHKATEDTSKPKRYVLEMFPYPSGDIHMGHVRNYTIGDVTARYYAMRGYDVLHPMGWDAFGLPAENAAIKHNSHPAKWTYANIETQKASFKRMGFSYDWDRTVVACDPEYYRWGQWIFLQMYKRGLVERRNSPVNWCPNCKTVLANEQVTEGECWRCHGAVEKRDLTQWYYKITDYAQELLDDLDQLEGWPEPVKQMQANWIGRSEGAEVDFELIPAEGKDDGQTITVFTTRPDTLFGCSFFLLAPESPLVHDLVCGTEYEAEVMALVEGAAKVSAVERAQGDREKHGAFTGRYVINPVNGEKVPVWVADYIVADYGTGAVMAVPCGDQRDFEFARKYDLPIIPIILGEDDPLYPELNGVQERKVTTVDWEKSYEAEGVLVQSGKYTGMVGGKHLLPLTPSSATWRLKVRARSRSSSVCATGSFPVSAIGVILSRLFTVMTAASCPFLRTSCLLRCPRISIWLLAKRLQRMSSSLSARARSAASLRVAKPTPWTPSRAQAGTTCAIPTRTTRDAAFLSRTDVNALDASRPVYWRY